MQRLFFELGRNRWINDAFDGLWQKSVGVTEGSYEIKLRFLRRPPETVVSSFRRRLRRRLRAKFFAPIHSTVYQGDAGAPITLLQGLAFSRGRSKPELGVHQGEMAM